MQISTRPSSVEPKPNPSWLPVKADEAPKIRRRENHLPPFMADLNEDAEVTHHALYTMGETEEGWYMFGKAFNEDGAEDFGRKKSAGRPPVGDARCEEAFLGDGAGESLLSGFECLDLGLGRAECAIL